MLHMAGIKTECESVDGSLLLILTTHELKSFILAWMGCYLFHLKRLTLLYRLKDCMFPDSLSSSQHL